MQLADQFSQIQTALAAGERIARMLHVEPEIGEPAQPAQVEWVDRTFKFDHVNFGYEPAQLVLRDLNFYVPTGQRVAIVGATGAGKTSLAGLLARFYDVNEGGVLIDGVDVRELSLADLRRLVTVVPQNPYCFNGTVADNLRLFDPSMTYEQMKEAAHIACADKFIDRLPGGYDFELLPGGANLSQGQRQLLALARALVHNPNSILDPRRSDQQYRYRDRSLHSRRAEARAGAADQPRDRAPPEHDPRSGSHPRDAARADHRGWHASATAQAQRGLCSVVPTPVRGKRAGRKIRRQFLKVVICSPGLGLPTAKTGLR